MSGNSAAKFRGCLTSLKIVKREREGAALGIEAVAVSARNRGASFSSGGVHQASPLFPAIQAFQSSVHNARTKMSNQRTRGRKKKKIVESREQNGSRHRYPSAHLAARV